MDSLLKSTGNQTVPALEMFSPEKIIQTLKAVEDCTDELVEIIKTTTPLQLKKLARIFVGVDNFEIEKIVELTVSRTRPHRLNATFLIFSLIKSNYLHESVLEKIEALFQTVFIARFRDIDPSIRAMCVQFMGEWVVASPALRNVEYLKYIGWALSDKNDLVRRRSVRVLLRLCRFIRSKNSEAMEAFISKYKLRLLEMAKLDCNVNVQKDSCELAMKIFLKNDGLIGQEEILQVISEDETCTDTKHLVMKKLCPEGIWDLDKLHSIFKSTKAHVFRNLRLTAADTCSLVLNIIEFIKNRSTCCDSGCFCLLNTLKVFKIDIDPANFIDLIETVKDNPENIRLAVAALSSVVSYAEHPGTTFKLLEYLRNLVVKNDCFIEEFVQMLKKLEDTYSLQIETVISELKAVHTYPIIKYFDVSDIVTENSTAITKCYASLWKIMNNDYEWVCNVKFEDLDVQAAAQDYFKLIDFAVFFHSKMGCLDTETAPLSPSVCAKMLFDKIIDLISRNFKFVDDESCVYLYKLISIGQFTHAAKTLYEFCSETTLVQLVTLSKDIRPLLQGYFEFLDEHRDSKKCLNQTFSKLLAGKVSTVDGDRYVFAQMKKLVNRTDALDTVLLSFVSCLNVNECIVLENLAPKSKFKTQLLRKCKLSRSVEENITFI